MFKYFIIFISIFSACSVIAKERNSSFRIAAGQYTETDFRTNFQGETEFEGAQTYLADIQIGKTLCNNSWIEFGPVFHYTRFLDGGYQKDTNGIELGVRLVYKMFPWSRWIKTRASFIEGLSWVQNVPYREYAHFTSKRNKRISKLLNFLDFTFSLSIGDIIQYRPLSDTYIGAGVWHRSGIFEKFASFHNTGLGTNYVIVFIETLF